MRHSFRIVKVFRICIGKRMINGYWIVCVFMTVSVTVSGIASVI